MHYISVGVENLAVLEDASVVIGVCHVCDHLCSLGRYLSREILRELNRHVQKHCQYNDKNDGINYRLLVGSNLVFVSLWPPDPHVIPQNRIYIVYYIINFKLLKEIFRNIYNLFKCSHAVFVIDKDFFGVILARKPSDLTLGVSA